MTTEQEQVREAIANILVLDYLPVVPLRKDAIATAHAYAKNRASALLALTYPNGQRMLEIAARDQTGSPDVYKKMLDEDANDLWRLSNAIKKEIEMRSWIMDGRGSYQWDDDRYRQETRLAFEAVLKLIQDVQHPAQQRFRDVMLTPQADSQGRMTKWVKVLLDEKAKVIR